MHTHEQTILDTIINRELIALHRGTTMHTIRKTTSDGRGLKTRLQIKGFKTSDAMHTFLNKQSDNSWTVNSEPDYYGGFKPELAELKPGKYAFAGGQYHNVKSLDASVLAHI